MEWKANSSNNTVFADSKGNIAYWHGNWIPKRNPKFDWSGTLDGSNPETDWSDLHAIEETVHLYNPANGWIQNCNSTPFTAAGEHSPIRKNYPNYMAPDGQNARGINAERVLLREDKFTIDKLIAAAYDPHLPGFENLIPSLVIAFESSKEPNTILTEPIALLKAWDFKTHVNSIPTTLAIYWAQELRKLCASDIPSRSSQLEVINFMASNTTAFKKLTALNNALAELEQDFGTWKIGWGEINRFQRLTGEINETFNDTKPSIAVPYTSSFWGSLPAFGSRKFEGTKKLYGYVGNSFVAAVEFGEKVKAKSLLAGGVSSDPTSPHFTDQAEIYAQGKFKEVLFYKEDVLKNAMRTYRPGDKIKK